MLPIVGPSDAPREQVTLGMLLLCWGVTLMREKPSTPSSASDGDELSSCTRAMRRAELCQ